MTNKFVTSMQSASNYTYTQNSALTHKSTLNAVLDYYYHAPARRGQNTDDLLSAAYGEDPKLALKVLFYLRDIRGGARIGERQTFRNGLRWLYNHDRSVFEKIVPFVAEYGRWDDILEFVDNDVVIRLVSTRFGDDLLNMWSDKPISQLAKWMPSENTSSKKTRELARKWRKAFGYTPAQYRRNLSLLRQKLNIVERLMSAGEFTAIIYEHVPSKAAMQYRKAFSKRDGDRYVAYLEAVKAGKKTIKASTLYPYEIVGKYLRGQYKDTTLEEQWKALPNYVADGGNALVVADVSGSMAGQPMEVSISLAIYFAERNTGPFKNVFMTFSGDGQFHTLRGATLYDRVNNVKNSDIAWHQNTNIQAAFDSILYTAVRNNVPAEDMPKMLFIISDMQFDSAQGNRRTNFEVIRNKYLAAGYEMPKLVFWNVDSFVTEVPVTQDQNGVYLVSGLSAGVFSAAVNTRAVTPLELMLETLNTDRYAFIDEL